MFLGLGEEENKYHHTKTEIKTGLKSIRKMCSVVNSLNLYSVLICGTFAHTLQLWARSLKDIFILRVSI